MTTTHIDPARRRLVQAAALLAFAPTLRAQGFPSKPVRIYLPQPPGGAADRLARVLGERLEARWKQSVVIENKPGGGVVIGTQATVRAAPDGHTHRPARQLAQHQRRAAQGPAL